jgi:hypothetical protein
LGFLRVPEPSFEKHHCNITLKIHAAISLPSLQVLDNLIFLTFIQMCREHLTQIRSWRGRGTEDRLVVVRGVVIMMTTPLCRRCVSQITGEKDVFSNSTL